MRKRYPAVYPKITITNNSASPLYLGITGKDQRGVWLAPAAPTPDPASSVDVIGIDLTDYRIVRLLRRLILDGTITVDISETFAEAIGATTTEEATTAAATTAEATTAEATTAEATTAE